MNKLLHLYDKTLEAVISACLVASAVIAVVEVVLRYIFSTSLTWSFEVLQILLTYMSFIGAVLALRYGGHLKIMVLVERLPRVWQIGSYFVSQAAIGLTAATMAAYGTLFALRFSEDVSDILQIPMLWLYIVIPVSGALMVAQVFADTVFGISRILLGSSIVSQTTHDLGDL